MSYNEKLEDWVDHYFIDYEDLTKKKQMGGVGWLLNGNMCVGVYEDLLVIRMEPDLSESLVQKEGISHFQQAEEELDQFISLTSTIYEHPKALHKFLNHAYDFTGTLPPKEHDTPSLDEDDIKQQSGE
ncbi:MAG: TfoX/Sxy family protein [Balneolaceae bacterium]|nr:TfoX/Sxy family protein [Balneolaceae bacterium]